MSRVGVVTLAAGVLLSAWLLAGSRAERDPTGTPPVAAPSPAGWGAGPPTSPPLLVREVAAPGEPSEAGGGAAPFVASTPALATAMPLRKQQSRLPPQEKPASPSRLEEGRCKTWKCLTAASCGWVLVACTGPQVRATPGPEDCPAGAVETMEGELNLPDEVLSADIPPGTRGEYVTVRAGEAAVTMNLKYGELDEGTVLTGKFILGKERLYGRFTRAQTPQGKTYPVCLEIVDRGPGERIKADAGADAVKVHARVSVRVVDSFESSE